MDECMINIASIPNSPNPKIKMPLELTHDGTWWHLLTGREKKKHENHTHETLSFAQVKNRKSSYSWNWPQLIQAIKRWPPHLVRRPSRRASSARWAWEQHQLGTLNTSSDLNRTHKRFDHEYKRVREYYNHRIEFIIEYSTNSGNW